VHEAARGCGYATEAVRALVAWALGQDGVARVTARCDPENTASVRVLEKTGFVRTGVDGELESWERDRP